MCGRSREETQIWAGRRPRPTSDETAEPQSAGEGADETGAGELPRGHTEDFGGRRVLRPANVRDRGGGEQGGSNEDEGGDAAVGGVAGGAFRLWRHAGGGRRVAVNALELT